MRKYIIAMLSCLLTGHAHASEQFVEDCRTSIIGVPEYGPTPEGQLERIRAEHDAVLQIWIDRRQFGIPWARIRGEQRYFFPEMITHDQASACLLTRLRTPPIKEDELFEWDSLKEIIGQPVALRGTLVRKANQTKTVAMKLSSGREIGLSFPHWWIWEAPAITGKIQQWHTEKEIVEVVGYISAVQSEEKFLPVIAVDQDGKRGLIEFLKRSYIEAKTIKLQAPTANVAKRN